MDENWELDARSTLVGGVDTRTWAGAGGDGRILGAARPPAVLQDRETVNQLAQQRETLLQERVNTLMNDMTEERRLREGTEAELFPVREFYDLFESPLAPKSQATKDIEAADKVASDLHAEDMAKLKEEHDAHVSAVEADYDEFRADAEEKYQHLLGKAEAPGYRRGTLGTSSSGARASTSDAFRQLKDFL